MPDTTYTSSSEIQRVLASAPDYKNFLDHYEALYGKADEFANNQAFTQAIACFKDCLNTASQVKSPYFADQLFRVWLRIGYCHSVLQQWDEALRYYLAIEAFIMDVMEAQPGSTGFENTLKQNKRRTIWSPLLPQDLTFLLPGGLDVRLYLAEATRSAATAYDNSNRLEQAKPYHKRTAEILTELKQRDPSLIDWFESRYKIDAIYYYEQGVSYQQVGNLRPALEAYSKAIRLSSNFVEAYENRGTVYQAMRQGSEAVADYNRVIQLAPNRPSAYYNRGNLYSNLAKWNDAIDDYTTALKIDPRHSNTHCNRAAVYRKIGNTEKALLDLKTALEINPEDAIAYYNRAEILWEQEKYRDGLADARQAVKLAPNFSQAHLLLGVIYANFDTADEAVAHVKKALEIDPQNKRAQNVLAGLEEAIRKEQAIRHSPDALMQRAFALMQRGDFIDAMADLEAATRLSPERADVWMNLGTVKKKLKDVDGALTDSSEAIRLDPKFALAYYNRGTAHAARDDFKNAIPDYDMAIKLDPKYAPAFFNRGNAYQMLLNNQQALKDFNEAVRLDPHFWQAYFNRASVRQTLNDPQGAEADFAQARKLNPNLENLLRH